MMGNREIDLAVPALFVVTAAYRGPLGTVRWEGLQKGWLL